MRSCCKEPQGRVWRSTDPVDSLEILGRAGLIKGRAPAARIFLAWLGIKDPGGQEAQGDLEDREAVRCPREHRLQVGAECLAVEEVAVQAVVAAEDDCSART